ncbi:unnamed protein product [Sympodiomycopsis kandeliae]
MAFRATRSVLNEVKTASPHKYTYVEGKTPFWRKFREIFSANPYISSGLPLPTENRFPTPGSRLEKDAATTPSRASDIAGNRYYERDFRRKYPALDMITQEHLTKLLLAAPNEDGTKTLAAPEDSRTTALTTPEDLSSPSAFTNVLAQVTSGKDSNTPGYSASHLPPTPPFKRPHHILKISPEQPPRSDQAYYPAENYH